MTSLRRFMLEAPADTGNPSGASGMSPADRARSLGLRSNGKGSYIDPSTGQVVARTVNNELVFYDPGPGGGAVSDGAGGMALTQAQPSWVDPMTGQITVPPSKAESPEEIGAVPDPIPAQAPMGYDAFMHAKKLQNYGDPEMQQMYSQQQIQTQQQQDQEQMSAQQGEEGQEMAMSAENYDPQSLANRANPQNLTAAQRAQGARKTFSQMRSQNPLPTDLPPTQATPPETRAQEREMERPRPDDKKIRSQAKSILGDLNQERLSDKIDVEGEEGRRGKLTAALDRLLANPEQQKGAGKNNLSREDIEAFKNYIEKGPQNERVPVSEDEMEYAMQYLQNKSGDKWNGMQGRLKGKGDPPAARKVKERGREVVQSYLENLGASAIDGEPLMFSESELDHGISLANGGEDNGENWRWLPTRFNQFKGALEDAELLDKLNKELEKDPTDDNLKKQQQDLTNKIRGDLTHQFKDGGFGDLNVADIMSQKGSDGMQFLKALAEANGVSYYKDRGKTRDSGRAGGGTSLAIGELQQRLIDELGIPEQSDIDKFDANFFEILDKIEEDRFQLNSAKKLRAKEKREAKKASKLKEDKQVFYTYDALVETLMEMFQ